MLKPEVQYNTIYELLNAFLLENQKFISILPISSKKICVELNFSIFDY